MGGGGGYYEGDGLRNEQVGLVEAMVEYLGEQLKMSVNDGVSTCVLGIGPLV